MKKITAEKEFDFKINSSLTIKISPKGVIVEDEVARNVGSRLPGVVVITDVLSEETPEVKEEPTPTEETTVVEETTVAEPVIEETADVVPSEEAPAPKRGRGANKNK